MSDVARAAVLVEPRTVEVRSLDVPDHGDDGALLRVEACGLCGTDHEMWSGMLFPGYPFVPGHETVGVIESIGAAAGEAWGVAVGDRVAVEVFRSCGRCAACRDGEERRCEHHGLGDMYGFQPLTRDGGLWGGWATHHLLAADTLVVPIPDHVDPVTATLFNPLGAGFRWAVDVPQTTAGEVVAVLGPGLRGLASVAATKAAGAGFVMVTGAGAGDADRLAAARAWGADLTVDVTTTDPVAALRDATGQAGADVVVDVTAGAAAAFGQAVAIARPGGRVVVAGTRGRVEAPGFYPDDVVAKELTIRGALGVDHDAYVRAVDLLASGTLPLDVVDRRVAGLDEVGDLVAAVAGEGGGVRPHHAVVVPG